MPIAFVMINIEPGRGKKVFGEVTEIDEVKDAYLIYGIYDIIARIEAETMQELKDVIGQKIRRIDHVLSTLTLIVM